MRTAMPELPEPAVGLLPAVTTMPDAPYGAAQTVREAPPSLARSWCVPTDPPPV